MHMQNHRFNWTNARSIWEFERRRCPVSVLEVSGSHFLIAVSMRNPSFSNEWLEEVLTCAKSWGCKVLLTLVDLPYLASIDVFSSGQPARQRALRIYERQCQEQATRLTRICDRYDETCDYLSWSTLVSLTPNSLFREVDAAFDARRKVYSLVMSQVAKVFPNVTEIPQLERLSHFLLREIPVLILLYYSLKPGAVDVYPGEQAKFFWELDLGHLANEMPISSELAASSSLGHTYARVELASIEDRS
jgi:hypothetical protein